MPNTERCHIELALDAYVANALKHLGPYPFAPASGRMRLDRPPASQHTPRDDDEPVRLDDTP